jgi:hypothetical protein
MASADELITSSLFHYPNSLQIIPYLAIFRYNRGGNKLNIYLIYKHSCLYKRLVYNIPELYFLKLLRIFVRNYQSNSLFSTTL